MSQAPRLRLSCIVYTHAWVVQFLPTRADLNSPDTSGTRARPGMICANFDSLKGGWIKETVKPSIAVREQIALLAGARSRESRLAV